MKSKKIVLFGPLVPPHNGQSIAFSMIVSAFPSNEVIVINTSRFQSKILNTLYSIIKTVYVFIFCSFSKIYFTSSRSKLGFIKDFPLLLLGRLSDKVIINHLHGADFKIFYNQSRLLKSLIRFCYESISISIVLIKEMENEYTNFHSMKIVTIHNCYSKDLDIMDRDICKNIQLLYLSNIMKSKGILEFLDASSFLLKSNSELIVNVAGAFIGDNQMNTNSIKKAFFKKFNTMKDSFGDRINFLGTVSGIEKRKLLFESSIFVLPSYYESEAYPISILEAMRAGNAIVVSRHNYLHKIINPNSGVVVEPMSSQSLIRGIESILHNPSKLKAIQEYNINQAKLNYSQERFVREVKEVISQQ